VSFLNIRRSIGERVFDLVNVVFMIIIMTITLYPFLYVLFASLSNPADLFRHQGIMWKPLGLSFEGYKLVFKNKMIAIGYGNTIFYVVVGTFINMVLTTMGAYGLSKKNVYWKPLIMKLVVFTMFFHGGLIPLFLLVRNLGLYNNRLALILPSAITTWNLIVMRTYFMGIPESMEESAKIDGANDFIILYKIIIPLSMPVIAVMILFYSVSHWNSWFHAMVFLMNRNLYPLQLVLREIIISNSTDNMITDVGGADKAYVGEVVKYATIVVAVVPIVLVYPFLQKYFVKGIMIGAIKG